MKKDKIKDVEYSLFYSLLGNLKEGRRLLSLKVGNDGLKGTKLEEM